MKKFFPATEYNSFNPNKPLFLGMLEEKEGYDETPKHYVPAKLAEEMLKDLYSLLTYVQAHYPNNITLIDMIKTAIKKAKEV